MTDKDRQGLVDAGLVLGLTPSEAHVYSVVADNLMEVMVAVTVEFPDTYHLFERLISEAQRRTYKELQSKEETIQ